LSAFDRILDRLEAVRRNGNRTAVARCPAHEDHNPSLSIRAIEGQVLVYCHFGCDTRDVLAAVEMTMSDLFDEPRGASYRYDDGRIVRRSTDKKFHQAGNTNGSRTTLYRLARVVDAVKRGEPILLVEGEKDVHALESVGVTATTAPMGAANFTKVDVSPLAGAQVIAVVDDDAAGETWAAQVLAKLDGKAKSLDFAKPKVGKDISDHIAAGLKLDQIVPWCPPATTAATTPVEDTRMVPPQTEPARRIRLTRASAIKPRPVRWVWSDRIPQGELTLTPGRGGIGKSTFHCWLVAHLTRGTLSGVHFGKKKPCIIAATEDSWDRTIVPRLIAAGADMDLVLRVDVVTETNEVMSISVPRDVDELIMEINRIGAALLSVDPVMSVLHSTLDSHKDREIRLGLEPLGRLADRTGCGVLGNAHFNKSTGSDPLALIMASAAFGNVPRAALGFARDPDDEDGACVVSQIKNNLGRLDLPSLKYRIDSAIIDTEEGPADVGRLVMIGESDRSVADILRDRGTDETSSVDEAAEWLRAFLGNGPKPSLEVVEHAREEAGISLRTLKRAKKDIGVESHKNEKVWWMSLPGSRVPTVPTVPGVA
jgi:5S rRNA maturation endonuclease (ribonuclease M5)